MFQWNPQTHAWVSTSPFYPQPAADGYRPPPPRWHPRPPYAAVNDYEAGVTKSPAFWFYAFAALVLLAILGIAIAILVLYLQDEDGDTTVIIVKNLCVSTCDDDCIGAVRYDPVYSVYEQCNGTDWVPHTECTICSSVCEGKTYTNASDITIYYCNGTDFIPILSVTSAVTIYQNSTEPCNCSNYECGNNTVIWIYDNKTTGERDPRLCNNYTGEWETLIGPQGPEGPQGPQGEAGGLGIAITFTPPCVCNGSDPTCNSSVYFYHNETGIMFNCDSNNSRWLSTQLYTIQGSQSNAVTSNCGAGASAVDGSNNTDCMQIANSLPILHFPALFYNVTYTDEGLATTRCTGGRYYYIYGITSETPTPEVDAYTTLISEATSSKTQVFNVNKTLAAGGYLIMGMSNNCTNGLNTWSVGANYREYYPVV